MDNIMRIAGLAMVMVVLLSYIRQVYFPLAVQVALVFVIVTFAVLSNSLKGAIDFFLELGEKSGVPSAYTSVVLRAIGVGYLASFAAQMAKDAREETVASMVEMAGKVAILLLAVPVVAGILEAMVGMMP